MGWLIEIDEKESLHFRTKYMFITSFVYLCCRLYDRIICFSDSVSITMSMLIVYLLSVSLTNYYDSFFMFLM